MAMTTALRPTGLLRDYVAMIRIICRCETLHAHRRAILELATRHGARNVRVFGSIARGEDRPDSDVDLLVDVEPGRSLLDVIALEQDLEALLGRPVDVQTDGGLSRTCSSGSCRSRGAMKDDRVYLQHIRDALQDIAEYCGSNHGAFLDDRMRQDATLRKLEIIGQAVKNLSEDTRSRRPEIPWRQIAGMRDGSPLCNGGCIE